MANNFVALSQLLSAECATCGRKSVTLCQCPCKKAYYCDVGCQRQDWEVHKTICTKAQRHVAARLNRCASCGSLSNVLKQCGCRTVYYCSLECQRKHYGAHRRICTVATARTGTGGAGGLTGSMLQGFGDSGLQGSSVGCQTEASCAQVIQKDQEEKKALLVAAKKRVQQRKDEEEEKELAEREETLQKLREENEAAEKQRQEQEQEKEGEKEESGGGAVVIEMQNKASSPSSSNQQHQAQQQQQPQQQESQEQEQEGEQQQKRRSPVNLSNRASSFVMPAEQEVPTAKAEHVKIVEQEEEAGK